MSNNFLPGKDFYPIFKRSIPISIIINLQNLEEGENSFKGKYSSDDLELPAGEYPAGVKITGFIQKSKKDYYLNFNLETQVRLSCDRCLKFFENNLNIKIYLVFTQDEHLVNKEGDEDVKLIKGDETELDITKDIRDYLKLERPLKSVCREDCKGLCPNCGRNLNTGNCDCKIDNIDSRWSELKNIKLN